MNEMIWNNRVTTTWQLEGYVRVQKQRKLILISRRKSDRRRRRRGFPKLVFTWVVFLFDETFPPPRVLASLASRKEIYFRPLLKFLSSEHPNRILYTRRLSLAPSKGTAKERLIDIARLIPAKLKLPTFQYKPPPAIERLTESPRDFATRFHVERSASSTRFWMTDVFLRNGLVVATRHVFLSLSRCTPARWCSPGRISLRRFTDLRGNHRRNSNGFDESRDHIWQSILDGVNHINFFFPKMYTIFYTRAGKGACKRLLWEHTESASPSSIILIGELSQL